MSYEREIKGLKNGFTRASPISKQNHDHISPLCWELEREGDGKREYRKHGHWLSLFPMAFLLAMFIFGWLALSVCVSAIHKICGDEASLEPAREKEKEKEFAQRDSRSFFFALKQRSFFRPVFRGGRKKREKKWMCH